VRQFLQPPEPARRLAHVVAAELDHVDLVRARMRSHCDLYLLRDHVRQLCATFRQIDHMLKVSLKLHFQVRTQLMILSQMRRPPQREDRLSRTDSNNGLVLRTGFVRGVTCLRCQGFGVALHYPRVSLHDRPCKNSYWGRDTHVLPSQDVWQEDTTPRHYLLMEMIVLHHHFHLLSQS
jgi:hypothetical protein